jgi:pimeloyl-ACP methyl ester carboxylesterase
VQELSFDTLGSGPGLVLVHGTSSTPIGTWGPCVEELARSFTVVLPYLPGSGNSPLPAGPLDVAVLAEQIADAATRAGVEHFAIAGASLGAPIAIKVAAMFPQRVTHLVAAAGYSRPRMGLRLREEVFEAVLPLGADVVGKLLLIFGMTDETAAVLPEDMVRTMAAQIGSTLAPGTREQIVLAYSIDVEDDLAGISVPTLVVAGNHDNFVDPAHSRHIAKRIPGATLLELPGGHGIAQEQTAQVVQAILELTGTTI